MKKSWTILFFLCLSVSQVFSNGVAIVDSYHAVYFRLDSSIVTVSVEGQISTTVTTQFFTNTHSLTQVKYAFPLGEQASAVKLRWNYSGQWYTAAIANTSQDTTQPGEGSQIDANLKTYLGNTPLYFPIPQVIQADSTLAVELTYVELLPYSAGNVDYVYPSDYHLIQSTLPGLQYFSFHLTSQRAIDSIHVLNSYPVQQIVNQGDTADVIINLRETPPTQNYAIRYRLSSTQLGLYAYSSMLPVLRVPDSLGTGFLTFIAEPDPYSTSSSMTKVFTLIIDRSGSMAGTKMDQAINAAKYIVQNLNPGDRFNLIDFDDIITCFRPGHVPYTQQSRDSALTYISSLYARGSTSISGVFGVAVPQFTSAADSTANIIIFLTDGQPTVGITDVSLLVPYINDLIRSSERRIFLFSFGIGDDVNQQLLTLLSTNNRGIAEFLGNDELYARITNFYREIRYPVLLDSHIQFSPAAVTEVYPDTLPNLYIGNQMIISGRYNQRTDVQITLSGTTFGRTASYTYNVQLTDSNIVNYQFLPKIWAKRKIESLLVHYYALVSTSGGAIALKNQIIALSQSYGIITPFTSFSNPGPVISVEKTNQASNLLSSEFELLGNFPNPFNPSTTIQIKVNSNFTGQVEIRIYNLLGQIIRTLHAQIHGQGVYTIFWNGLNESGLPLASGVYFYGVEIHNTILIGKMNFVK